MSKKSLLWMALGMATLASTSVLASGGRDAECDEDGDVSHASASLPPSVALLSLQQILNDVAVTTSEARSAQYTRLLEMWNEKGEKQKETRTEIAPIFWDMAQQETHPHRMEALRVLVDSRDSLEQGMLVDVLKLFRELAQESQE